MSNHISTYGITFKDNLLNIQYKDVYAGMLDNIEVSPISLQFLAEINDLLNLILVKHPGITKFQQDSLIDLFAKFNDIRETIDPNRLKPFEYSMSCDDELILYRKSEVGVTSITLNPEECLAFSFIPYNNADDRVFFFVEQNDDFEALALKFFAY